MIAFETAFRELTDDRLARPLPPALRAARADVVAAARDVLALDDAELPRPWAWIGGSEEEVRYGAYRAAEALEHGERDARRLVAAGAAADTEASRILAPSTAARWDLDGLLLGLADADLDADPGGGEWPIRLVLGHTLTSQLAYGLGSTWWLANRFDAADPALPASPPDELYDVLPEEETSAGTGGVDDVRALLDGAVDLIAERLAGIPDASLANAARWSGYAVTVGFRLARCSSHIREHTIQVDKTLDLLGRRRTETQRLARLLLATYGRAEEAVFGRQAPDPALARIASAAAEAREAAAGARAAAEAARGATAEIARGATAG